MRIFLIFLVFIALCAGMMVLGLCSTMCSSAVKVIEKEFTPEVMLKKYEWFKNCSASMQAKLADIQVYQARVDNLTKQLNGRQDRTAQERYDVMTSELAGMVASYNNTAAEYNAQASKFNWSHFEGEVPRVIAPYKTGADR